MNLVKAEKQSNWMFCDAVKGQTRVNDQHICQIYELISKFFVFFCKLTENLRPSGWLRLGGGVGGVGGDTIRSVAVIIDAVFL